MCFNRRPIMLFLKRDIVINQEVLFVPLFVSKIVRRAKKESLKLWMQRETFTFKDQFPRE